MFDYEICSDKTKCSGCGLCYQICNAEAIQWIANKEGFLHPEIDKEKCLKCGKCKKICPQNSPKHLECQQKAYAAWTKDKNIRFNSSSGGLFSELAIEFINKGGVVAGAAFNSEFMVEHIIVDTVEQLHLLRGSKYVQSDTSTIYSQVGEYIKNKTCVLFSGTPCQVDAMKRYVDIMNLDKSYLYTIDLVCHGVPSPMIWDDYLNMLSAKYKSKPSTVSFRNKDSSWMYFNMKINFENTSVYKKVSQDDSYLRGFLREFTIRESCYTCQYASQNRQGDITLSDFWGYKSTSDEDKDTDEGISLVITNNHKGETLFESIRDNCIIFNRSVQESMLGNKSFSSPWQKPKNRSEFWDCYYNFGYSKKTIKKFLDTDNNVNKRNKIKQKKKKYKRNFKLFSRRLARKILGDKFSEKVKSFLSIIRK